MVVVEELGLTAADVEALEVEADVEAVVVVDDVDVDVVVEDGVGGTGTMTLAVVVDVPIVVGGAGVVIGSMV